jgi:hypothetical protein
MGYHNDLVRSFSENWYEMKNEKLKMPHVGTWRCGTTRDYDSAKRTSYLVAHFAASNVQLNITTILPTIPPYDPYVRSFYYQAYYRTAAAISNL